jgi:hypothetical protein
VTAQDNRFRLHDQRNRRRRLGRAEAAGLHRPAKGRVQPRAEDPAPAATPLGPQPAA